MPATSRPYGRLPDGRDARLFVLDGGEGVTADITNYGGIITSLRTPDRTGDTGEIGLGRTVLQEYVALPAYYGALIGRVGNRIGGGAFTLDGKEYTLYTPPGGQHLHGGKEGFNRKLWNAEQTADGVRLTYLSPDGEENYPGNLSVTAEYSLRGRELTIDYTATTDAPTLVNLTNHTFFNLNCCAGDVNSHVLRMAADRYTPVDAKMIPTGEILPVRGTPFDFRTAKAIKKDQAQVPGGYDHNFVLADGGKPGEWLVEVHDPDSGRTLEMATTEPCVQFYGGNFLDGSDVGPAGIPFKKHYGFCLEAQKHPDAIHHPNFANTVLRPGETYRQTTTYRFGAK